MNYETKVDLAGVNHMPDEDQEAVEARSKRRRVIVIALVVVGLLAAGAMFYLGHGQESPFPPPDGDQVPTVSVIAPGQNSVEGAVNATGTLAARRQMPIGVVGEGGRVVSVNVEPGDWVKSGQVLAVIDRSVQSEQAQSAAAQVEVAKADAELAQANLDRALQLVDRGFVSQADVDRLTATRDAAVARVRVAEAQYRELLQRNARLNIVAPAAGLVLERNVEPGQVVGSGSGDLFTIAKDGQMELLANLNEDDLAAVSVGATAIVHPVGSNESFAGRIWQISPVIDPANRQGVARIALSYDQAIRPGGFASVEIDRGALVAPRLPESAIMSDEQGSYVFVIGDENRVIRRNVETGIVTSEGIAVVSGLKGDERIVMRAGGFLNEGDKVKPVLAEDGEQATGS
ncbi:RND family efflux transporter MFP subunit [Altererythrobacter atlanticus]|uniref:Efflux pump periplasmic linker BepF n=1 Tax=Croceibacterium atlanticum TaxID=1267766 RepID=A0A0F7KUT9_9SPHN|nr:efflux RND transporter periplasmic adaptor subunit [Croceibacterium atlanticum]AKH43394.1 Efflux pump periplasmic linker BepF [Croceibacterium atlanticum]MBB5731899.1 RND family efflux transporter MFP subunit [Croceibacterium atlanticum]